MERFTGLLGNFAAMAGLLVCLVWGGARVLGNYHILNFSTNALFQTGIGLMVLACLCKLHVLSGRSR